MRQADAHEERQAARHAGRAGRRLIRPDRAGNVFEHADGFAYLSLGFEEMGR